MSSQKFSLTMDHWSLLFKEVFKVFPSTWWRLGVLIIFTIFVYLAGILVCGILSFIILGGVSGVENFMANISYGGMPLFSLSKIIGMGLILFLLFNIFLIFGIILKISMLLVFKNYTKQKTGNLARIYFVESWHYFIRYIILHFRAYWPFYLYFLALVLFGFIGIIISSYQEFPNYIWILIPLSLLFMIPYGVYRLIQVIFYKYALIHFDDNTQITFQNALAMTRGNWWGVFGFLLLYGLIYMSAIFVIYIFLYLFVLVGMIGGPAAIIVFSIIRMIVDFGLRIFVFPVFDNAFFYFFMHLLTEKKQIVFSRK